MSLVNLRSYYCQVKKTNLFEVQIYLYLLVEKTMFKSHVNLFSSIITTNTTITKWNYLKSKLEVKQRELNKQTKQ